MAKKTHSSPEAAREAILDAAEASVLEHGPAGLRIGAVAKTAGMAHPNIIYHFGSREGLLNALSERVGARSTKKITEAINLALNSPEADRVAAMTNILNSAYSGDQGKIAVWLHLSGANSSLTNNMHKIVSAAHELRKSMYNKVTKSSTDRIVMLVTLALVGEVVTGSEMKEALGYEAPKKAHFRQWLAELLINLSDHELEFSLDIEESITNKDNNHVKI